MSPSKRAAPPAGLADTPPWRVPGRVAYVVNHSYPYSSNGYAVRTHGVARGLIQLGHSVVVVNRPGRPWDMRGFDDPRFPLFRDVDGVRYVFIPQLSMAEKGGAAKSEWAAQALTSTLRVFKPSAVLAASNWENARLAEVAARQLGVPFFYEVRGLWELSRLAREPGWDRSPEFRHEVEMETQVANAADLVFTLNTQLREELIRRGVAANKIRLAPNGFGDLPDLSQPPRRSAAALGLRGRQVVGYVGSFGAYEGLDALVRACATLYRRGGDLSLLLVGSSQPQGIAEPGPCVVSEELMALARQLDFGDRLVLPGRLAPSELADYYAAIDLIVIPRRPLRVCEMVTPLKPLEAAAFGKPMVLSDVAPLRELATLSGGAALFRAGDETALVETIGNLLQDPDRRRAMATAAREWVSRERNWPAVLQTLHEALPAPCAARAAPRPMLARQGLRHLRVAAVMDDFTYASFAPECELLQLTPEGAISELMQFGPELLFVESAWRGKGELWNRKISTLSPELRGALAWCKERRIPTVFWNKEDPVHFETFLTTAQQFDHVFTTDIDCVGRYKAALGHDRVYLLPFACQPRDHNPIELYERKDAFCFAGAYYVRYPERTRDLEGYVQELPKFRPLEIFDRNFGKDDPNYQFPPAYRPYIVGTLPFTEIDKAYKGYRYSINLNSVKQSQTMFARRVYELLGCNTITVSNYSRGLRLMFGDLVITSDSGSEIVRRLQALAGDAEHSGKFRLAGLRKAMTEHTYHQRLGYIAKKALGITPEDVRPPILVIASVEDVGGVQRLLGQFKSQTYARRQLLLVCSDDQVLATLREVETAPRVHMMPASALSQAGVRSMLAAEGWIAAWRPEDYYGPNYLMDLAIAATYSEAVVIGKVARYERHGDNVLLVDEHAAYRSAESIPARCAIVRADRLMSVAVALEHLRTLGSTPLRADQIGPCLAIDPYNYCLGGAMPGIDLSLAERVGDLSLDVGLSIDELMRTAERIEPTPDIPGGTAHWSGSDLASLFAPIVHSNIRFEVRDKQWHVRSNLPEGKHEYFFANRELLPGETRAAKTINYHIEATPGLNLQLMLGFLDERRQKISHVVQTANRNHTVELPAGTAFIRLALRVFGPGQAAVKSLLWDHRRIDPAVVMGRGRRLLLSNQYPAYDDLYRYGFVHSRVKAYQRRGERVDVFRLRDNVSASYHEFEDVDCITGSSEALDSMLSSGRYETVLVHFLDPAMWGVLCKHIDRLRVIVWVHGSEIQPYHRRDYNYSNEVDRARAQRQSDVRMSFWRQLLRPMHPKLSLVFVSRYFAEEVMEDLGFRLPEDQYAVIHNPIDTDLFRYEPKSADQRWKVLSIRPYASLKYANDLSVKAILELSRHPEFARMEFRLIGDGPLFESTLEPLRGFANVKIERGFLQQSRIAELQRDYGLFLTPTRWDSQGVSRDEAMAAGLVPITNALAAIPEFVDERCGILTASEDFRGMAAEMLRLFHDPTLFQSMSKAAAERVRRQSSGEQILSRELALIRGTSPTVAGSLAGGVLRSDASYSSNLGAGTAY